MRVETLPDPDTLARAAAEHVARLASAAIAARGRFTMALSGGSTPWIMLRELAALDVDWSKVHVFQVDERAVPDGDDARNWTHVTASLLDAVAIPSTHLHPMPVLDPPDAAAATYAATLAAVTGPDQVLDLAQLGLGGDGHTASLVPDDPVLDVTDRDVAWTTNLYQGTHRMTLTYPCLARARTLLWLVAGAGKRAIVGRMMERDHAIPAGRLPQDNAVLFADHAASPTAG